jgi:hypothetical protein
MLPREPVQVRQEGEKFKVASEQDEPDLLTQMPNMITKRCYLHMNAMLLLCPAAIDWARQRAEGRGVRA